MMAPKGLGRNFPPSYLCSGNQEITLFADIQRGGESRVCYIKHFMSSTSSQWQGFPVPNKEEGQAARMVNSRTPPSPPLSSHKPGRHILYQRHPS